MVIDTSARSVPVQLCPWCRGTQFEPAGQRGDGVQLHRCATCGLLSVATTFVDVESLYDSAYFGQGNKPDEREGVGYAEYVLPLLCAPALADAVRAVGRVMGAIGLRPGAGLTGMLEGFASLSAVDARRAQSPQGDPADTVPAPPPPPPSPSGPWAPGEDTTVQQPPDAPR